MLNHKVLGLGLMLISTHILAQGKDQAVQVDLLPSELIFESKKGVLTRKIFKFLLESTPGETSKEKELKLLQGLLQQHLLGQDHASFEGNYEIFREMNALVKNRLALHWPSVELKVSKNLKTFEHKNKPILVATYGANSKVYLSQVFALSNIHEKKEIREGNLELLKAKAKEVANLEFLSDLTKKDPFLAQLKSVLIHKYAYGQALEKHGLAKDFHQVSPIVLKQMEKVSHAEMQKYFHKHSRDFRQTAQKTCEFIKVKNRILADKVYQMAQKETSLAKIVQQLGPKAQWGEMTVQNNSLTMKRPLLERFCFLAPHSQKKIRTPLRLPTQEYVLFRTKALKTQVLSLMDPAIAHEVRYKVALQKLRNLFQQKLQAQLKALKPQVNQRYFPYGPVQI